MTRLMISKSRFLAALVASGIAGWTGSAAAASPYTVIPPEEVLQASPAHRYANMTNDEAFAELRRRGVAYERTSPLYGVRAPIRLRGALHGVDIHSSLPAEERADTVFEVLDARLALALDDFSSLLAEHDVVELVHYTMYRPNVAKPDADDQEKGVLHAKSGQGLAHAEKGKEGEIDKAPDAPAAEPQADKEKPKKHKGKHKKKGKAQNGEKSKAKKDKAKDKEPKTDKPADKPAEDKAADKTMDPPAAKGAPIDAPPAPKAEDKPAEKKSHAHGKKHPKAGHGKPEKEAHEPQRTRPAKAHKAHDKNAKGKARASAEEPAPLPSGIRHAVVDDVHELESEEKSPLKKVSWAPPGTRHPAGLAIDVGGLRKQDGRWLSVASHFGGHIGAQTCGAGAKPPATAEGRELWSIVCGANERGLFTYVLTPNYNAAHADHFHMEIKAGSRFVLFQ